MKKLISLVLAVMLALSVVSAFADARDGGQTLEPMEIAKENVKALRKQLLAPDTMTLNSDVYIVEIGNGTLNYSMLGEAYTLYVISYSSMNEYGVPIHETVLFDGNKYIGTEKDLEKVQNEINELKLKSDRLEGMDKLQALADARELQIYHVKYSGYYGINASNYSEYSGMISGFSRVSGEWIAEELGIEFKSFD